MTKTKNKNKKYVNTKKRSLNVRMLNIVFLLLFFAMSASYIFGVNDLSIKGFVLYENKVKVSELKEKNKDLELRIMALESNENLHKKAGEMQLVVADNIEYIPVPDDMVAKR